MTSWRTRLVGLMAAVVTALVGCGGGGESGTPITGGAEAADLALVLSSSTISNAGTQTVTATVTALDSRRNALPNAAVRVAVDANATVQVASTKTGADGTLAAVIGVGSDRTVRKITITATSGTVVKTAELQVTEGGDTGVKKAADMTLTLSALTLANSGTQTVTATVTTVDANRNVIKDVPVTFAVDLGATVKPSGTVTDDDGRITAAISIGDDQSNRTITVTATSGTLVSKRTLQVTGAQIKTTLLPPALGPGDSGKVQFRVADVNGNPVPYKEIRITGPGPVEKTGTSDINGDYEFTYVAPSTTGDYVIRAAAIGTETKATLKVLTGGTIPDVTIPVQAASVSANPSVVPINRTGQTNQATIRALFLSTNNKPVENVRVRFDLDDDKQSIGGSFTSADTIVYSDANGVATTSYIAGQRFSPTDGVTVRACWDTKEFAAGSCPNAARTTLTVIADALSVTVGTNNLIQIDPSALKYVKRYAVQVVDSSGLAAADVQISASVDLLKYGKGYWVKGLETWNQVLVKECDNEDLNRNGVAEVFSNGVIEDANSSFNNPLGRAALEPRKADVAVSFEGGNKTDTRGTVVLRVEYPQNVASWVQFNLVVAASGVAGSEGRADFVAYLPVLADHIKLDTTPPFVRSPYGIETSPTVPASEPGSNRPEAMLCENRN